MSDGVDIGSPLRNRSSYERSLTAGVFVPTVSNSNSLTTVFVQTPDADAHARGTLLHLAVDKPEQIDLIVRLWPVLLWDSLGLVRAVTDTANESDRTDSADTVRSRPPEQIMS